MSQLLALAALADPNYRLNITAGAESDAALQLGEVRFYSSGLNTPTAGVTVTNPGWQSTISCASVGCDPTNLVDGNLASGWVDAHTTSLLEFDVPFGSVFAYELVSGTFATPTDVVTTMPAFGTRCSEEEVDVLALEWQVDGRPVQGDVQPSVNHVTHRSLETLRQPNASGTRGAGR